MGYLELEANIRAKSKREAEELSSEYARGAAKIRSDSEASAQEARRRILNGAAKDAELRRRTIAGAARNEAMRRVGREKALIVDGVFEAAKEALSSLPAEKRAGLLNRLLADADAIDGPKIVRTGRGNGGLLKPRKDAAVVEEDVGGFGLIIESEDGSIRVDNRIGPLVERMKTSLKPGVGGILFR